MIALHPNKNEENSFLLNIYPDEIKERKILGITFWRSSIFKDNIPAQIAKFINEFGNVFVFKQANSKPTYKWPESLPGKLAGINYKEDENNTYFVPEGLDQLSTVMNALWNWDIDDVIIPIDSDLKSAEKFSHHFQKSKISFSATLDFEIDIRTDYYSCKELKTIADKVNKIIKR